MKFSEVTRSPYVAEVVEGLNSFCQDETPIRDSFGSSPVTGLPKPSRMRAMWLEICEGQGGKVPTAPINVPPTPQPILTIRPTAAELPNEPLTGNANAGSAVGLWYAQASFQAFQARAGCTHQPYSPRVRVES